MLIMMNVNIINIHTLWDAFISIDKYKNTEYSGFQGLYESYVILSEYDYTEECDNITIIEENLNKFKELYYIIKKMAQSSILIANFVHDTKTVSFYEDNISKKIHIMITDIDICAYFCINAFNTKEHLFVCYEKNKAYSSDFIYEYDDLLFMNYDDICQLTDINELINIIMS